MERYLPSATDLGGLATTWLVAVILTLAGAALVGRRLPPEVQIGAGWGGLCLLLTVWGALTPLSLAIPAASFVVAAFCVLAFPDRRPSSTAWKTLGRLLLLSLPLWLVMAPIRPSQPDTWLNLLPNAFYLLDWGRLPTAALPRSYSYLPAAPYNTQFLSYLGGLVSPNYPAAGMSLINVALLLTTGLLVGPCPCRTIPRRGCGPALGRRCRRHPCGDSVQSRLCSALPLVGLRRDGACRHCRHGGLAPGVGTRRDRRRRTASAAPPARPRVVGDGRRQAVGHRARCGTGRRRADQQLRRARPAAQGCLAVRGRSAAARGVALRNVAVLGRPCRGRRIEAAALGRMELAQCRRHRGKRACRGARQSRLFRRRPRRVDEPADTAVAAGLDPDDAAADVERGALHALQRISVPDLYRRFSDADERGGAFLLPLQYASLAGAGAGADPDGPRSAAAVVARARPVGPPGAGADSARPAGAARLRQAAALRSRHAAAAGVGFGEEPRALPAGRRSSGTAAARRQRQCGDDADRGPR